MESFRRSHMIEDVGKDNFHRYPSAAFEHAWELIADEDKQEDDLEQEEQK